MFHMLGTMGMNLTMLRYLNAKGARLSKGKANPRVRACVVLVGLQRMEIVLSTLNEYQTCYCSCGFTINAVSDVHSISDIRSETGGIDYMMYAHVVVVAGPTRETVSGDVVCHSLLVNQSQILPVLLPLVIQDLLV